jgi:transketolase
MISSYKDLEAKADQIRRAILRMSLEGNYGHIPSALSCVEILVALYYRVMEANDVFIMSKGHGALALYAILEDRRRSSELLWESLPGCLEADAKIGNRCSSGSLGHGLPFAVGIALGKRLKGKPGRIYCLVGDAELQEGSCEEAIGLMNQLHPIPLEVLIDTNGFGAMQKVTVHRPNYAYARDGHNIADIIEEFDTVCAYLHWFKTVKGKGVPFMEEAAKKGDGGFHFRPISCMTREQKLWVESFVRSRPKKR